MRPSSTLLAQAGLLRDKAEQLLREATRFVLLSSQEAFTKLAANLRVQATELELRAAGETAQRPAALAEQGETESSRGTLPTMAEEKSALLNKAARLRDEAGRALRFSTGLSAKNDQDIFTKYATELREKADELERQAAAATSRRPAEPDINASDEPKTKKGRAGSKDPEPQA